MPIEQRARLLAARYSNQGCARPTQDGRKYAGYIDLV